MQMNTDNANSIPSYPALFAALIICVHLWLLLLCRRHRAYRPAHFHQPFEMRRERAPETFVRRVADAEFSAGVFDDFGKRGIVDVADLGEQMMLHLEIEPAEE